MEESQTLDEALERERLLFPAWTSFGLTSAGYLDTVAGGDNYNYTPFDSACYI